MIGNGWRDAFAKPPNRTALEIELLNRSKIQFKSAEKYDNLRGEGVHFFHDSRDLWNYFLCVLPKLRVLRHYLSHDGLHVGPAFVEYGVLQRVFPYEGFRRAPEPPPVLAGQMI